METLIYHTVKDFKKNLRKEFAKSNTKDFLCFLENEKSKYEQYLSSFKIGEEDYPSQNKYFAVCETINEHFPIKERLIVYNVLDFIPTEDEVEYLENVFERELTSFEKQLIKQYTELREKSSKEIRQPLKKLLPYTRIIHCIENNITEETNRVYYSKLSSMEGLKDTEKEVSIITAEINTSKTKNIALLHYTGILDFLRSRYPMISDNQLAGFFELLTKEPITARNQSAQFTKDKSSFKYPIKNSQDKEELDLILTRFGMKEILLQKDSEI